VVQQQPAPRPVQAGVVVRAVRFVKGLFNRR
jgi:hypothetical protein